MMILHYKDNEEVVLVEVVCDLRGESHDDVVAHVVDETQGEDTQIVETFVLLVVVGLYEGMRVSENKLVTRVPSILN